MKGLFVGVFSSLSKIENTKINMMTNNINNINYIYKILKL